MPRIKSASDELQTFLDNSTLELQKAILRIAASEFKNNSQEKNKAIRRLANLIATTEGVADMMGRRRLLIEADSMSGTTPISMQAAEGQNLIIPNVTFQEALDSFAEREPRLVDAAVEVADVYNLEHGFTLARAADEKIIHAVQDIITAGLAGNTPIKTIPDLIEAIGPFSRGYADTVFRTNVTSAFTAGRLRMASDPNIAQVIIALQYVAVLDSNVRPNHAAAHGIIATVNDPVWNRLSPPLGFNCRCGLRMISESEARRLGAFSGGEIVRSRINPQAQADSTDFGQRPDSRIYS